MIIKKTPEEIEAMARSGAILARCLQMLRSKARAGVTTLDLDEAAEKFIRSQGAEPAFKGYRGFPGSICSSPNSDSRITSSSTEGRKACGARLHQRLNQTRGPHHSCC